MARRLRLDPEDGWHHVMNRGVAKQVVFHTAHEARTFLDLLAEAAGVTGVEVHAYALMPNHYHLLVHCPAGGVSAFMQRLGARFTQAINQHRERDGALFRGRFHSKFVDSFEYVDLVGRYIHRNPLDLRPVVALDRFRWSSYGAYVGTTVAPEWLHTAVLSDMHCGPAGYREFVEGDSVRGRAGLGHVAIRLAVAELDDELPDVRNRAQAERLVAVALLERGMAADVELLGAMSPAALRTARSRVRRRLAEQPWLTVAVERALQLAA